MPIYKYRCNCCGNTFENLSRIAEPYDMTTCPECGTSDYHDYLISLCHQYWPGGMPSYQSLAEEDLYGQEEN